MAQNGHLAVTARPLARTADVATPNLPKKLIIACDGTWMDSDNKPGVPTNISRLSRAILNEDDKHYQQVVYYQAGVGTGYGIINYLLGGGIGLGLAEHIREAYSFLANNYSDGARPDSIFLLGFSRGAFTARSIGGLLGAIGLLTKRAMPYFFDIFKDWQNAGRKPPCFFKKYFEDDEAERAKYEPSKELWSRRSAEDIDKYMTAYRNSLLLCGLTREVKIQCIGVFDTVGSLGVPVHPFFQTVIPWLPPYFRPYGWFDTRIGDHVEYGFHALALDEKRSAFHPTLWELREKDTAHIKQVWFPGSHGNVGGGYDDTGIADVTISWMMDHLSGHELADERDFKAEHWIQFDQEFLDSYYEKRRSHYIKQLKQDKAMKEWPEWALGPVHNSYVFPFTLAGSRVRTPGRYLFTKHDTGREIKGQLLQNTNESIHASVRERIHKGGLAPEPRPLPFPLNIGTLIRKAYYALRGRLVGGRRWPLYMPMLSGQALQDWKLQDGHSDHDKPHQEAEVEVAKGVKAYWRYTGSKPGPQKLEEDNIGTIQRKLLEMDAHPDLVSSKDGPSRQGWVDSITTRARRTFKISNTF